MEHSLHDTAAHDLARATPLSRSHRHHAFTDTELRTARSLRNARGQKMTPTRILQAQQLHRAGSTIAEIAAEIGVSRSTVHRHLR
ncbi:Hin recombinase [Microbacteriaceae bacterium VKM Ac-2855]|nr:Hin recombinase [Microbacteriaceae bacterium VKM Ac-2855]